jgi:hypothetical protein
VAGQARPVSVVTAPGAARPRRAYGPVSLIRSAGADRPYWVLRLPCSSGAAIVARPPAARRRRFRLAVRGPQWERRTRFNAPYTLRAISQYTETYGCGSGAAAPPLPLWQLQPPVTVCQCQWWRHWRVAGRAVTVATSRPGQARPPAPPSHPGSPTTAACQQRCLLSVTPLLRPATAPAPRARTRAA